MARLRDDQAAKMVDGRPNVATVLGLYSKLAVPSR
ncbi:hypothetical protein BDI24065_06315 [Burkholderia diffusa]|uniref:Uncharacterized protein n=1 Tax=Burkholderia diffusa TaxID=488732 RepID=A0A6P2R2W0_9BURK|nr:hypothetical protein BDI24065_06315 [Burkholderia diffusa]